MQQPITPILAHPARPFDELVAERDAPTTSRDGQAVNFVGPLASFAFGRRRG